MKRTLSLLVWFLLTVGLLGISVMPVCADPVKVDISRVPLSLVKNQGQSDPMVLYRADAAGHSIFFTRDAVVFAAAGGSPAAASVVSITVPGQEPGCVVQGESPLAGTANYFLGDDPSGWVADAPTFGAVRYAGVLSGVDLVYSGSMGLLKREIVLAPGVDPASVKVRYTGQDSLSCDASGQLEIRTPLGTLIEAAPVCYQDIGGMRIDVACQYIVLGDGLIGFTLGPYNDSYPVVIDPWLDFSSYLGGSDEDRGLAVAADSAGATYVTGFTRSTNFPLPLSGVYQEVKGGALDIFVVKLDPPGNVLNYSTYIGGSFDDVGQGIAVDPEGNAYITGYTSSDDYPVPNAFQPVKGNTYPDADAFVTVLNPVGDNLLWSSYLGGNCSDVAQALALMGNMTLVTGYTGSPDFPNTSGAYCQTWNGGNDVFVTGLDDTSGTPVLAFSSFLGGSGTDQGYGIAVNQSGEIFLTGLTRSWNFPTLNYYHQNISGNQDAFITKMTPDASALIYSTYLGGLGDEAGYGIAVDPAGNAMVTGFTQSGGFQVTPNALQKMKSGIQDAFLVKMRSDGKALNYSTFLGGIQVDTGTGIVVDDSGSATIVGFTDSSNFPIKNEIYANRDGYKYDAFITRFTPNMTQLLFSTYLGGEYDDRGMGIARQGSNITVTGWTQSRDFPLLNPFQGSYAGAFDAFVARIASAPPVANFTGEANGITNDTVLKGLPPLLVNFTDLSTGSPTAWSWLFGDGNTSQLQNPSHVYYTGNWTVNLTASNIDGSNSTGKYWYVQVGLPLIVNFSANISGTLCDPCSGRIPLTVNFTDLTNDTPNYWNWSFGDGNFSDIQHPAWTYTSIGIYNVTLTAGNDYGNRSRTKNAFVEAGDVPKANFTATPRQGIADLNVSFTDTSIAIPAVTSWNWSFGDISPNATTQNPSHIYNRTGSYNVTLTVVNKYGNDTHFEPFYINVGEIPKANFTAVPMTGVEPLNVTFTDFSTGFPTWWRWDFGDGNITNMTTNITMDHIYTNAGNYTPALTVGNAYGTNTDQWHRGPPDFRFISVFGNATVEHLKIKPSPMILPTNATTAGNFYLEKADRGISGYNLTIYFTDPSAGQFVEFTPPPWANASWVQNSSVPASSITMTVFDSDNVILPTSMPIPLGSFKATGVTPMTTTINATVRVMTSDTGDAILVHVYPSAVTVVALQWIPETPPFTIFGPPTDPDHDGVFWDLNGNGVIDFVDVVLYFRNMSWIAANEPVSLFDYDKNGSIDFHDLFLLFQKV